MTKIIAVKHVINERVGGTDEEPVMESAGRIEYEFAADVTADEKQAVEAYGCYSPDEFGDAVEWWDALQNASGFKDFMGRTDISRARIGRRGNGT